ncbi:MAG: hypothetical protein COA52_03425 [Hyphomicrobiales bacterium]|nr:phage head closure protein [Hyphomicrobiales bacterium]PCJ95685.1 MAG: hypothetical protein COA52_03425 [Hyphomicrobiales bacterium]
MSAPVGAGCLRMVLTLEAALNTTDVGGGLIQIWLAYGPVFTEIKPLGAHERQRAHHLGGEITHEITVRTHPQRPVKSGMRFVNGLRIFRILAVHDGEELGAHQICLVKEDEQ